MFSVEDLTEQRSWIFGFLCCSFTFPELDTAFARTDCEAEVFREKYSRVEVSRES